MNILIYWIAVLLFFLTACDPPAEDTGREEDPGNERGDYMYFPLPDDPGELIESNDQAFYKQTVVSGLGVPWGMAFLPDGRMLISEREGSLRIVEDGELLDNAVTGTPNVKVQNQGGLLDVRIHPDYEENGWIYMTYSYPGDEGSHTALARGKLDGDAMTGVEVLFKGKPEVPGGRHLGSRIAFKDGYVYFSTGDRGERYDAQETDNHSGSIIRLYDNGDVPEDNPFYDDDEAMPELYTYGHRNPQGMDIHPETGEIWIHEHGPKGGDEINIIKAGANYGWPLMTQGTEYDGSTITEDTLLDGMEPYIHHWTPSIAPCGMTFVTSDKYPEWQGDILSGALAKEFLNRTVLEGQSVIREERLLERIGRVRNVEEGPDGYIYVANESDGEIIRLLPAE